YAGDHGLTALRARVLHRADAAAVPHGLRRHWEAGATVFGPVFTGFGEWAVERARAYGVDHVHCLMREGRFLSQVLAAPADEAGVEVSTLWASRQVCALASVFDGSPYELRSFLHRRRPPSVGQLAAQLGVGLHEVPGLADLAEARLDVPGVIDDTLAAISAEPRVRGEIVLKASRLRERLLRYLDRYLPDRGTVVLVDLGWGGTIQALLQRLLRATGREVELVGLYLATNASAQPHALDGVRTEGYVATAGEPGRLFGPVMRSPEVLEQLCMPDLGSLVGFDEHLEPLLSAVRVPRTQVAQKSAVQAGVLAFQREWLRYRRGEAGVPSLSTAPARRQLLRTLSRFVARPTAEEALAFGVWSHDENFGSDATEGLVRDETLRLLPYLTPYDLDKLSMQELYWPAGVASVVNKPLAVVAGLAAQAGIAPEAVSPPAPAGPVEVYVDQGADFADGPKQTVVPRSSRDGLSLARVRVQGERVRRVRIDPAGRRGLLRVDWLRLTFHLHNVVDPRPVELTSLAASPQLHVLGARLLQSNLVEITTDDPQIVYVLDPATQADLTAATYAVDVELAFAWMGVRSEPLAVLPPPQTGAPQPLTRRAVRRLAREVAERL
ncbi:MAG TPA: haloacid dehalogenase, partial [Frankiaceae bacterium]|nr:haloacid dehalogenase [Frankiaceae bacterium]